MTCKGTEFTNYKVAPEDAATIAGRDLSISMTRWSSDVSHQGFTKLARDTGDPAVIATIDALLEALACAKAAVQAYVKVRP
jgi:hypothetical protein